MVASIILSPISDEAFTKDANVVLAKIADDSGRYAAFIVLDTLANFIAIPVAATLFMVFRSHDRNLALLGSGEPETPKQLAHGRSRARLRQEFVLFSRHQCNLPLNAAQSIQREERAVLDVFMTRRVVMVQKPHRSLHARLPIRVAFYARIGFTANTVYHFVYLHIHTPPQNLRPQCRNR